MVEFLNRGSRMPMWYSDEFYARRNVTITRDEYDVLTIGISINSTGMRLGISPEAAREMAAALLEIADTVEADPYKKPEKNDG